MMVINQTIFLISVLGPLLYSNYSNDLPTKLKFCNAQMYADDVQLYISCLSFDITNCIQKINCDLHNVFQWASINGVCLNPRKLKALIIDKVNYTRSNEGSLLPTGAIMVSMGN